MVRNNEVNMLYIDEPNLVGYSYDVLTNVTLNLLTTDEWGSTLRPANFSSGGVPDQNLTFLVGTHGSQNITHTANTTMHAAVAFWHFAQTWFAEFPAYKPHDEKISLFAESYGGKYGPAFARFFVRQNERIADGTLRGPGLHYLHLDTLGLVNGCVDSLYQEPAYAEFSYNNTYGIPIINETMLVSQRHWMHRPGGVLDHIRACQEAAEALDPDGCGNNDEVNRLCLEASAIGRNASLGLFEAIARYAYMDITHPVVDSFPPGYWVGFLNRAWVQQALGVPVNHTAESATVARAFLSLTADFDKGGRIEDIAELLDHGVKVAMMYGDRDWRVANKTL